MTGLTWLPRRVWLDNPEEARHLPVYACGRQERVIRRCVFDGTGSTKTDEEARAGHGVTRMSFIPASAKGDVIPLHAP